MMIKMQWRLLAAESDGGKLNVFWSEWPDSDRYSIGASQKNVGLGSIDVLCG